MTFLRCGSALRRARAAGDDGVAILMALAYISMFTLLMLSMLSVVIGQVKPTAQARKDVGSVNAASSGLQAALTAIRESTNAEGNGDRGRLPCSPGNITTFRTGTASAQSAGTVLDGDAATVPGAFRYQVHVAYFLEDPTDKPPSWLRINAMHCPLHSTPLFAYLQSYGTGANVARAGGSTGNRGNRAQTAVYRFSVPGENIAGGRIAIFGQDACIDAGPAPRQGSALTVEACAESGTAPRQMWEYRSDLTLFYGGDPSLNLCIQGTNGTPTTTQPTLQRCTGTGTGATYPYESTKHQAQEWSYNDAGSWSAAGDWGNAEWDTCLRAEGAAPGSALIIGDCGQQFDPHPSVGAGKAGGNTTGLVGSPTNQYVNFAEFGRCLDITYQDVTMHYLIAFPCKQAPDSTTLTFNQVWGWKVAAGNRGRMYVTARDGLDWCMYAPASGPFPVMELCDDAEQDQEWIATGKIPDSPETSYHLISVTRGECLSITDVYGVDSANSAKIIVEPCEDRPEQRWNAPPSVPSSGLESLKEGATPR